MRTFRSDRRRIDARKPRASAYDVRDRERKGCAVQILPSGTGRNCIHCEHGGWHYGQFVGEAETLGIKQARRDARALLAATRERGDKVAPALAVLRVELIAVEMFRRNARLRRPSTLKTNRRHFRNHIVRGFRTRPIDSITSRDVYLCSAFLHSNSFAADPSALVIATILREAEL